jgi:hypothetical protein
MRVAGVVILLVACVLAQASAQKHKITAEQVLAHYDQALGLSELTHVKNLYIKAVQKPVPELSPQYRGDMDCIYEADGRMREQLFETSVVFTRGFDGKHFWTSGVGRSYPIMPWRRQDDGKNEDRHAPFNSVFVPLVPGWQNDWKQIKLLGVSPVRGHNAFLIRATNKDGYSINLFFDTETYLLVRADVPMIFKSEANEQKRGFVSTTYWMDYRPHKILQENNEIDVEAASFDVQFDERKFSPTSRIRQYTLH